MKVMIFDTETTGLPKTKIINQETLEKWPHIVQFSFIIFDTDLNDITELQNFIVRLDREIPEESIKFHGITNAISREKGINIEIVLNQFFYYLKDFLLILFRESSHES